MVCFMALGCDSFVLFIGSNSNCTRDFLFFIFPIALMRDNDYECSTCSFLFKLLRITPTYLELHSMHVTLYTKTFILLLLLIL